MKAGLSSPILFCLCTALFTGCVVPKKQGFNLVHQESFSIIDAGRWEKAGHTFSNNLAAFSAENIKTENNILHLNLTAEKKDGKDFSGAELRTVELLGYGKFVARLKAATGAGIVTAFFLYNPAGDNKHEIDVEFTGKNTNQIHLNHYVNKTGNLKTIALSFDASKAFHDYAIVRLPKEIRWEIDGVEVYRTKSDIPTQPMKLIFNLWISNPNDWVGTINPACLPQKAEVESLKIYALGD